MPKEMPFAPAPEESVRETPPNRYVAAESLYRQGRYGEAADTLVAALAEHTSDPPAFSLLARALANQGNLPDALSWCDRWVTADKLNSAGHYLRAVILLEQATKRRRTHRCSELSISILTLCCPFCPG